MAAPPHDGDHAYSELSTYMLFDDFFHLPRLSPPPLLSREVVFYERSQRSNTKTEQQIEHERRLLPPLPPPPLPSCLPRS